MQWWGNNKYTHKTMIVHLRTQYYINYIYCSFFRTFYIGQNFKAVKEGDVSVKRTDQEQTHGIMYTRYSILTLVPDTKIRKI